MQQKRGISWPRRHFRGPRRQDLDGASQERKGKSDEGGANNSGAVGESLQRES